MKEIVFATNNLNKLSEVQLMVSDNFRVISLAEIGCTEEVPETGNTLEANALEKARYISKKFKCNVFADDTGLEVSILNGEPGVFSARYAGPQRSSEQNMSKLLENLKDEKNRAARFRTVIALILDGEEKVFEGEVNGKITQNKSGVKGFGYDPIFIPDGFKETFAEMSAAEKNKISHRGRAVKLLVDYLLNKEYKK